MPTMTTEPTKLDQDHEWAQLIARTAQGDQAALATFYDRTSPQVFGFICKILSNREAAEEVTLDVYTQVWRQAHTYDQRRGAPGAWLMTVARTRAIDRLRARATEYGRLESLDAVELFASSDETPEENVEGEERRRYVQEALAGLTARTQAGSVTGRSAGTGRRCRTAASAARPAPSSSAPAASAATPPAA